MSHATLVVGAHTCQSKYLGRSLDDWVSSSPLVCNLYIALLVMVGGPCNMLHFGERDIIVGHALLLTHVQPCYFWRLVHNLEDFVISIPVQPGFVTIHWHQERHLKHKTPVLATLCWSQGPARCCGLVALVPLGFWCCCPDSSTLGF